MDNVENLLLNETFSTLVQQGYYRDGFSTENMHYKLYDLIDKYIITEEAALKVAKGTVGKERLLAVDKFISNKKLLKQYLSGYVPLYVLSHICNYYIDDIEMLQTIIEWGLNRSNNLKYDSFKKMKTSDKLREAVDAAIALLKLS